MLNKIQLNSTYYDFLYSSPYGTQAQAFKPESSSIKWH